MPTDVKTDIPIGHASSAVEVTVISGFAQITTFGLKYQHPDGTTRLIVDLHEGKIGRLYEVGAPGEILQNGGLVCWGRVFKTGGDQYRVICSFKQDSQALRDSDEVSGKFAAGQEHVDFSIKCSFS